MSDVLDEYIARYSNWGRWGAADQVGTANFITREHVRDAAGLVTQGRVVSLALPLDDDGPQTGAHGRFNCLRYSNSTGADHASGRQVWEGRPFPREVGFADDSVVLHLHSATHWDSLAHVFHRGAMYNGFAAAEVTADGAARGGVERLRENLVGRGVLLDVPASKGSNWLDDGYAITVDDLEGAAEAHGVVVGEGDILFVRTGQMARRRREGWGTYAGGDAPGLSLRTIPWLAERRVAALATDTWGVEVRPNELPDSYQPFHIAAIVYMGLVLGEMFDLDGLAALCARNSRYEFLACAPPLPFTGAAGGPPGPVALL